MTRSDVPPLQGSAVRLRSLTTLTGLALALLALIACSVLVVFTNISRLGTDDVQDRMESMRAADAMRSQLLAYARQSDLAYLARAHRRDAARMQAEADLLADVADARRSVRAAAEKQQLRDADEKIKEYLVLRTTAEREGRPLQEVLTASTPSFEAALSSVDSLARTEQEALTRAHWSLHRWATVGKIVGVTVASLVLFGFVAVLLALKRFVFVPLSEIVDSVDRYAAGDHKVRIAPSGPAEFRRTAETLNEIADRLDREEHDRLTFLGGVAHDLRNPLAALQMAVRYLEPDHPLPTEEKIRRTLDIVGRQVTVLNRMVGDFLDATRIEGGHLELRLEPHDLRDIVREVAELYRTMSFSHRVRLSMPDDPLLVRCDGVRIEQVLNNLLSNAIKYSPAGGDVEVSARRQDGDVVIAVSDHGIGIAATERERIFEPFRRTGASREVAAGVGLGLSVARRIVAAHGGRIEVQSQVGVGSTFRVRLPPAGPMTEAVGAVPLH